MLAHISGCSGPAAPSAGGQGPPRESAMGKRCIITSQHHDPHVWTHICGHPHVWRTQSTTPPPNVRTHSRPQATLLLRFQLMFLAFRLGQLARQQLLDLCPKPTVPADVPLLGAASRLILTNSLSGGSRHIRSRHSRTRHQRETRPGRKAGVARRLSLSNTFRDHVAA